jgi:hypothetical protein
LDEGQGGLGDLAPATVIVRAWPRFFISMISVTLGLCSCCWQEAFVHRASSCSVIVSALAGASDWVLVVATSFGLLPHLLSAVSAGG